MTHLLRVLRWETAVDEELLASLVATLRHELPHYASTPITKGRMPSDETWFTSTITGERALLADRTLKYPTGLLHHLYRTIRPEEHRIAITDLPLIVPGNPYSERVVSDDRNWAVISAAEIDGATAPLTYLMLHKAGHFLGLRHCTEKEGLCAMACDSNDDANKSRAMLCDKCRTMLKGPYTRVTERCVQY